MMRKLNMFMLLEKLESLATIQSKNPRRLFFSLCSLPHNTRNTTSSTAATFFVCEKNGFLGRPPNKKKKKGAERTLCSLRKTWLNVRHRARWQRARTLSAGTPTQDGYVLCGQMTELGSLPVISHPFEYSLCSLRAFFRNVFQDSGR